MEPLPLLPKSSLFPLPDITCVVRKTFQDVFEKDVPPEHIAENLYVSTFHSDPEFRKHVLDLVEIYKNHKDSLTEISDVESRLMHLHANQMCREDDYSQDPLLQEVLKLKEHTQFKDLDPALVKKYHLLQGSDLLPPKHLQVADFKAEQFRMLKRKRELSDTNLFPFTKKEITSSEGGLTRLSKTPKWGDMKVELPCLSSIKEEDEPTIEERTDTLPKTSFKSKRIAPKSALPKPKVKGHTAGTSSLLVEPNKIVFTDYEVMHSYFQTIRVKNIGVVPVKCRVVPLLLTSTFGVKFIPGEDAVKFLTAGNSFNIEIVFIPDTLDDHNDTLIIQVMNDVNIEIPLHGGRIAPVVLVWTELLPYVIGNEMYPAIINCGQCMAGNVAPIYVNIQNIGGEGCFCIFTETEWYSESLKKIMPREEVVTSEFNVSPAYFSLLEKEAKILTVTFHPETFGDYRLNIVIVCDNCCIKNIQLKGIGICYNENFIKFLDITKVFPFEVEDDFEADYYLDLGEVLFERETEERFFIQNTTFAQLSFHWTKRSASRASYKTLDFKVLPQNLLKIVPSTGTIDPYSTKEFNVVCSMKDENPGSYRLIISFYLEKIHGKSFVNLPCTVNSYPIDSQFYNILCKEVEIWVRCVPLNIYLEPWKIDVRGYVSTSVSRYAKICNRTNVIQSFRWNNLTLKDYAITIYPVNGHISPGDDVCCEVTITGEIRKEFVREIRCYIENTSKVLLLVVSFKLKGATLKVNPDLLHFGTVKLKDIHTKTFTTQNTSTLPTLWVTKELQPHYESRLTSEIYDTQLDKDVGYFASFKEQVDIIADFNTDKERPFSSYLLLSVPKSQNTECILVVGDIQVPQLYLDVSSIDMSTQYIGVQTEYVVTLKNQSILQTKYKWINPIGKDKSVLDIVITPNKGDLKSRDFTQINLTIVPKFKTTVEEFYLPCLIEITPNPLFLSLSCKIVGVHVSFYFPESRTVFTKQMEICKSIFDPEFILSELEEISGNKISLTSVYTNSDNTEKHSLRKFTESLNEHNGDKLLQTTVEDENKHSQLLSENLSMSSKEQEDNRDVSLSPSELDNILEERVQGEDMTDIDVFRLKNRPLEILVFPPASEGHIKVKHEFMCLNFGTVSIDEVVKQSFTIKNETPVPTYFRLSLKQFYGKDPIEETIQDVHLKIYGKPRNELALRILEGNAAIFVTNPNSGELPPHGSGIIEVSFYANIWGKYVDEITCEIGGELTYFVALVAEVEGIPVNFNINQIASSSAIMRFSPRQYNGPPEVRSIRLINSGSVDAVISWYCFLKDGNYQYPFNAVLHIPGEETPRFGDFEVSLVPFYGFQSCKVFDVRPMKSFIPAKGEASINIVFDPVELKEGQSTTTFECIAVGYIHISKEDKHFAPKSTRKDGYEMPPLYLNIFGEVVSVVDVITLAADISEKELEFVFSTNDILYSKSKTAADVRSYSLENRNRAPISADLCTSEPFRIKHITREKHKVVGKKLPLGPGEIGKVFVECVLRKRDISDALTMLRKRTSSEYAICEIRETKKSVTWMRDLIIQQDQIKNVIQLKATLLFPLFNINKTHVSFGLVALKQTKIETVSVINMSTVCAKFKVHLQQENSAFQIEPKCCVLQPPTKSGHIIPLKIQFTPLEAKTYHGTVTILGDVEDTFEVTLSAVGTWNAKFLVSGK